MEREPLSIAVVGAGVAGLTSALLLARRGNKVTLIESESRLGGHALTVTVDESLPPVDLGFQVYNLTTYPLLTRLFDELGVETEPSDMSFSCSSETSEWGSLGLSSLFATPSNLYKPKFLSMIREIFRFATEAKRDLTLLDDNTTLGDYLQKNKYESSFAKDYLLPMTAAVWSVPYNKMLDYPAKAMIRFWDNHHLLNALGNRPRWRVVASRSESYVKAVELELYRLHAEILTSCKVNECFDRTQDGMSLRFETGLSRRFDRVVFCTHSDTALSILGSQASSEERSILQCIAYEPNRVILHCDESLMPRSKAAWASWNVIQRESQSNDAGVCVTYWLNLLQNLPANCKTLLCTLNPVIEIDPKAILLDMVLSHPVFNAAALQAQEKMNKLQSEVDTKRVVSFGGAWLGNGFHEDGAKSALRLANSLSPPKNFLEMDGWSVEEKGPEPNPGNTIERLGLSVFDYVTKRSVKKGYLKFVLPTGDEIGPYGRQSRAEAVSLGEPVAELRIRDVSLFWRIIRDSDIGLGEAYMEKLFDLPKGHDDLCGLFALLIDNRDSFARNLGMSSSFSPVLLLASGLYKCGNLIQWFRHSMRKNTISGSRQNIHEHYDLGNEFYKLFLDETMTYSAGIHAGPHVSLKDAQLAKYDRIISKAKLTRASHVLEIGCGWGGFAARAVETTGCKVTGVTISTEQLAYALDRINSLGYTDNADLVFCDYRNIPITMKQSSFDAIVSIEMLEAVGHENLPHFFDVVDKMLKPDGVAVIQVIGLANERYEEYMNGSDFIRRHIFPGGHLPCMNALEESISKTQLGIEEVFDIGPDYAESLLEWRKRFYAQKPKLIEMGFSEIFVRKWLFYFAYCEVGFRQKYIYDWQIVFGKRGQAKASSPQALSTRSWDFITGMFFGAWLVLCSIAVLERGRHLLVIPVSMSLSLVMNRVIVNRAEHNKYDYGAIVSSLFMIFACLFSYLCDTSVLETCSQVTVLIGTGIMAADLSALVSTGAYVPRTIRVMFMAIELSFLSISAFYGPVLEPGLHTVMFGHLFNSSLFHICLHADVLFESNKVVKAAMPLLLATCFLAHCAGLASSPSMLSTAFLTCAVGYDAIAALGVVSSITKKVA